MPELKNPAFGKQIPNSKQPLKPLTQLTFAGLDDNQFTHVPPSVYHWNEVYNLWLHDNDITRLPTELANLKSLSHLLIDPKKIPTTDLAYLKQKKPSLRILDY